MNSFREESIKILFDTIEILQSGSFTNYDIIEGIDEAIGLLERADEIEHGQKV